MTAATAASAADAQVQVQLVGLTPAQVHDAVVAAANKACAAAIDRDVFGEFGTQDDCVAATVQSTLNKLATDDTRYDVAQVETASSH
jgi:hypothetical protein